MPFVAGSKATIAYEQVGEGPDIVWVSGGGDAGDSWDTYQLPHFRRSFRNTTFTNRGIAPTTCRQPLPWTIADMARDTAELIRAVCEPPVVVAGLSMGGLIVVQLALDAPELVRAGIAMGAAARSHGWLSYYMQAEIDYREAGGSLDGEMAVAHYAASLYPARVLGDPVLWPRIREELTAWIRTGINEESLIAQWDACQTFDVTDRLADCTVPLHVFSFAEDVQVPPQYGRELADLCPTATYHLFEGMGHCSIYGHEHERLNAEIEAIAGARTARKDGRSRDRARPCRR
jgi:pimeloyl-ACP methyl ester carboxylesterase